MIKVCGMREAGNIRAVEALGIDLMGFIFYPKSKRYVAKVPEYLPTMCKRVGVFVNADDDFIAERVAAFGLDILQLHGNETAERVAEVKARFRLPIIKAVSLPCDDMAEDCDWLLFETPCATYGGSGQQFDWQLLEHYKGHTPFLLSGGIGPEDAARIKALKHPRMAGIDLNSRFEVESGIKDTRLLEQFITQL